MNYQELGQLGGIQTSIRFGVNRCPLCGHLAERSEFHAQNGAKGGYKGGRKVVMLYGREHMSRIGKLGGRPKGGNYG